MTVLGGTPPPSDKSGRLPAFDCYPIGIHTGKNFGLLMPKGVSNHVFRGLGIACLIET